MKLLCETTALTMPDGQSSEWWLLDDAGAAVAFMKTMREPFVDEGKWLLCDIETRPERRREGFARQLIEEASRVMGETLYTSGNCTPEGFTALPRVDALVLQGEQWYASYRSMNFVSDWDEREPEYPTRYGEKKEKLWEIESGS